MQAMDIDPIDDGPRGPLPIPPPPPPPLLPLTTANMSPEEEAKQAIEQLRGNDTNLRVTAANKLDQVAATLGPERTRNVRTWQCSVVNTSFWMARSSIISLHFEYYAGTFAIFAGNSG